jgi:hypothetical protein
MRGMARWILFAAALASCGRNSAQNGARGADTGATTTQPIDAASARAAGDASADGPQGTTMTSNTFHVRSNADLDGLDAAISQAHKAGAPELRVVLGAGPFDRGISLRTPALDASMSFVLEAEGATAVLRGGVDVEGKDVSIRGIVIDGASAPANIVQLRAAGVLTVDGLSVVGARSGSSSGERDPLVTIGATTRGATAIVRNLWVVASRGAGGVIGIPQLGRGRWASVELDGVALAGNEARFGVDALGTDALTIRNAFVAETALSDTFLWLRTYGPVTIADSVIAIRGDFAELAGDDAPKVKVTNSELLGPTKKAPIDADGVTFGKAPPAALDTTFVAAAAREGKAPDRAALRAQLP